ncbi:hypothetical protein [Rossellomorea vietnamensis]|uniref:hypothetical protein n=1 Tax=Rossellomorea vietnamensis TaxID=218284 RepID=UPI001E30B821|nr:hypothetical protein [Rossellomorea vietnamensis]MCC5801844.1 hypothetical protein [Rossellomorea vietnamensis]
MNTYLEIVRVIILPLVIAFGAILLKSYIDFRAVKKVDLKEAVSKHNKIESHYYRMRGHIGSLYSNVNNERGPRYEWRKWLLELKEINNIMDEFEMDILPCKALKQDCGYVIHATKIRISEIERIISGEEINKIEEHLTNLHLSVLIFHDKYLKKLDEYLTDNKK